MAFIFLNLFIAVILEGYERSSAIEDGMITGSDYDMFREAWSKFDPKGTCYIETAELLPFISLLEPPLG